MLYVKAYSGALTLGSSCLGISLGYCNGRVPCVAQSLPSFVPFENDGFGRKCKLPYRMLAKTRPLLLMNPVERYAPEPFA